MLQSKCLGCQGKGIERKKVTSYSDMAHGPVGKEEDKSTIRCIVEKRKSPDNLEHPFCLYCGPGSSYHVVHVATLTARTAPSEPVQREQSWLSELLKVTDGQVAEQGHESRPDFKSQVLSSLPTAVARDDFLGEVT